MRQASNTTIIAIGMEIIVGMFSYVVGMSSYVVGMSSYVVGMSSYVVGMSSYVVGMSSYVVGMFSYVVGMSSYVIDMSNYVVGMSMSLVCLAMSLVCLDHRFEKKYLLIFVRWDTPTHTKGKEMKCYSDINKFYYSPEIKQHKVDIAGELKTELLDWKNGGIIEKINQKPAAK
jgi:hypothetical protein